MSKPVATLEIFDEVNVRFRQVDMDTMNRCSKRLAFFAPAYRFQPSFKIGRWDGKIRLLNASTGFTYLNVIDLILPEIEQTYEIQIIDHRQDFHHLMDKIEFVTEDMFVQYVWPADHERAGEPIILRDYQVDAANACIAAGSGLALMGTSGGKSLMCAALAHRYMNVGNVVVVVPTIDLVFQTRKTFRTVGIDCGIWYGGEKDRQQVTMSTWQSLEGYDELFDGANTFIIDEVQGAKAKVLGEILSGPGAKVPFRFGCTGSLPPEELAQKQIIGVVGRPVYTRTIRQMQDEGYLTETLIQQLELDDKANPSYPRQIVRDSDTGKTKTVWGHHEYIEEIKWMHQSEARMAWIVEFIRGLAKQGKTLVLLQHHAYHEKLMAVLPEAVGITGNIPATKREPLWDLFRGDRDLAIATSGVGSTGIDVPAIRYVVGIEMGKSLVKVLQTLGRGLRKSKRKDWMDFIDLHGNAKMSLNHANERKRIFEEAGQRVTRTKVEYL